MTPTLAVWLIYLVTLSAVALFSGDQTARWLLLSTPVVLAAGCGVAFVASRSASVGFSFGEAGAKGSDVRGEIVLNNPCPLPITQLRCRVRIENLLTGQSAVQRLSLSAPGRGEGRRPIALNSGLCGRIHLTVERAEVTDIFGVFRFGLKRPFDMWATVLPDTFGMKLLLDPSSLTREDSDDYENRPGNDPSEIYQIRDYQQGDSLRQIHWKLSQKHDQLIVKQPGSPMVRSLLLLADLRRPGGRNPMPQVMDCLAEVAVSISQELVALGIKHTVAWFDQTGSAMMERSVSTIDELGEVVSGLLSSQGMDDGIGILDHFANAFGPIEYARAVIICRSDCSVGDFGDLPVTLLCCGVDDSNDSGAVYFTPADYRQTLELLNI